MKIIKSDIRILTFLIALTLFCIILLVVFSNITDIIQFGILIVMIFTVYIPILIQNSNVEKNKILSKNLLKKQLLFIIDYVHNNTVDLECRLNVKELVDMINELKSYQLDILSLFQCLLNDPSYKSFKLFETYIIGINGVERHYYNEGCPYHKILINEIKEINLLKARIKRI